MLKKTSEVVQAAGLGPLIVSIFTRLAVLLPPWLIMFIVLPGFAAISHWKWGQPPIVTWAAMAGTLATVVLTTLTWLVSHARGPIGRWHSTLSTAAACMWWTIATITGVTATATSFFWFFGGTTLAIGWNLRAVIRTGNHGEDSSSHRGGDALKQLFERSRETFGLKGATVKTTEVTDRKIAAVLELEAGKDIADDAAKKAKYMESGMELPPGSVNVTADRDNAARAFVHVSDPRILDAMVPWPGPSRPGGSVLEPLRVAVFQDATDAEPELPPNNIQVMGASGSGKSLFGAWNLFAELITRRDVATFGVDLAKDIQTFRPLRPAMYGTHITKAKAIEFIDKLAELIPQRTKWLAERGYSDWRPESGLLFWFIDFEEIAKIFDELPTKSTDKIEQISKEIRSAGGRIMTSLQRSTHTEMPTIIRSQMGFWCFGLNDKDDNEFGLSDKQQQAGANPAQWGAGKKEHIGKGFLDLAGIPDTHVAMACRGYAFGATVEEATANLAEHAAQWPAADRPLDPFTLQLAMVDDDFAARLEAVGGPAMLQPGTAQQAEPEAEGEPLSDELAELLAQAAELIVATQHATTAMLSRKFRLGYDDAQQIMAALEMKGIVGPDPGPGQPRPVLIAADDAEDVATALREDGHPVAEYLHTPDPDPTVTAGPYDPIHTPTLREDPFHTTTPQQAAERRDRTLTPGEARAVVHAWICEQGAGAVFTATTDDLARIRTETGNTSRSWINKVLNELVDQGVLDKDTSGPAHRFKVADLGPLGRELVDA